MLEVHDLSKPTDSDDDRRSSGSSNDSNDDGMPGRGDSSLQPWPHVHRLVSGVDYTGEPWLSLPPRSGGATWSSAGQQRPSPGMCLPVGPMGETVHSAMMTPPRSLAHEDSVCPTGEMVHFVMTAPS
jgi:hypothetical protein